MAKKYEADGSSRQDADSIDQAHIIKDAPPTAAENTLVITAKAPESAAIVQQDPWFQLNAFTQARISLGRVGTSLPTSAVQALALAHAMARDAVHLALDVSSLVKQLNSLGLEAITVTSQASNRAEYLRRPDLGRCLSEPSLERLTGITLANNTLLLVVADGLSALAIGNHGAALIAQIQAQLPTDWSLGPAIVVTQARVAIGDDIAERLNATQVAVLIGERPGLSTPDSLGIYFTHAPKVGCCDAERNCISNVHSQGLSYLTAASKLIWLAKEAQRLKVSGVMLKDMS